MKRSITRIGLGLGLALTSLPLAACTEDGYSSSVGSTWYSNRYDGWYDGYYGPIYDGYWGTNNYFYFRQNDRDHYRRGDRRHFYRGDRAPNSRFRRFEGETRQPPPGTRMPNFPGNERRYDRDNHDGRRGDRDWSPDR